MGPSAAVLVRELATRMGELVLVHATPGGTTTQLVDPLLIQQYPQDIPRPHLNGWLYGSRMSPGLGDGVDLLNQGVERRAAAWDSANTRLTLYAPMPALMQQGTYELYQRTPRARKFAALNDAVRQLDSGWFRQVEDHSLTTTQSEWGYALNPAIPWVQITRVEIQINPEASFGHYPFAPGAQWNVAVRKSVDRWGENTWLLQFGTLPPPGRQIRVWGLAGYPDLEQDDDILGLPDAWNDALGWVYDYAEYRLWAWEANRQPSGQTERLRQAKIDALMAAKDNLLQNAPSRPNMRLSVPGRGIGQFPSGATDSSWLGAVGAGH